MHANEATQHCHPERSEGSTPQDDKPLLREVAAALEGLRYGSVEIVVHDSRVVQIERREKMRLSPEGGRKAVGA
jgi:hypothetical protein